MASKLLVLLLLLSAGRLAQAQLALTSTGCAATGTQYVSYPGGCQLVASGGTAPYAYSWLVVTDASSATIPEGLVLDANAGTITGTLYGQGHYVTKYVVTDSLGATAQTSITLSIQGDNTLGGCKFFPDDTIFHTDISNYPVDTSPAAPIWDIYDALPIQTIFGSGGSVPFGIPFIKLPYDQAQVPVTTTTYQSYFTSAPYTSYTPIEGTSNNVSDRHAMVLQLAGGGNPCRLWEMWEARNNVTAWQDGSNAYWGDLGSYVMTPQGPEHGGTTDAAGLPVSPLLVNADEVMGTGTPTTPNGKVTHPIRFTLNQVLSRHVWPATNQSTNHGICTGGYTNADTGQITQDNPPTSCTAFSPYGEIYRLKAGSPSPACAAASPQAAIIIEGLRHYGMIVADIGITGGLVGTPDSRWNGTDLACLNQLHMSDLEPVNVSSIALDQFTSFQVGPFSELSTSTSGYGHGTVSGCADNILVGQSYTCAITPTAGSYVQNVTGCGGTLLGSSYSGTMPSSDCVVSAEFEPLPSSRWTVGTSRGWQGVRIQ